MLPPDSEAVAHAPEIFTDRLQPLGVLKERPHTPQDHEGGPQDPAHLDEVENDLASCVPVALALPSIKGLAGETSRDDVNPHVLRPLGAKLNGVAPCGGGGGMGMGRIVRVGGLPVNVTSPDGGRAEGLGRHREASYSARQVGMRPGCLRVLGVPRLPDKARALRILTTAVIDSWRPTWNSWASTRWGKIGLASAQT